ncbi:response regulator [Legionella tunisiensis]|uniref:response regulator n=1 Tax=Legionella tunisiensis TaxID=1034944 RepID=UPI0002EE8F8F|nr:response regulator [Legionella tunisiensis]
MSTPKKSDSTKPQLLVIEDNFICQKIYLALFNNYYDIELAGTVAEALECLSKQAFHCIISDIGLPDKSGMELLPIIRNSLLNKETPIVVISGHMSKAIKQMCLQLGATEVYTKPVTSVIVQHIIETFL